MQDYRIHSKKEREREEGPRYQNSLLEREKEDRRYSDRKIHSEREREEGRR